MSFPPAESRPHYPPWLMLALIVAVYFPTAGGYAIIDADDADYANMAWNMIARGDLVTPYVNEVRNLDKPPLLAWLIAAGYSLLGKTEYAARLPAAVFVTGIALLLYRMARRAAGDMAGLTAALAFALCPGTYLFTREAMTDVVLIFFLVLAHSCFLQWYLEDRRLLPALGFYAALAGAVMAKGLIGVVIPSLTAVAFLAGAPRKPAFSQLYLPQGGLLFLAVAAPWHILAAVRNEGFLQYYFLHEHVHRFLGSREVPDYESLPRLAFLALSLVWAFPWVSLLPAGWLARADLRAHPEATKETLRLCWIWIAVVLGFFLLSSRLAHYAFPALPPISLAAGIFFGLGMKAPRASPLARSPRLAFNALVIIGLAASVAAIGAVAWLRYSTAPAARQSAEVRPRAADGGDFEAIADLPPQTLIQFQAPILAVGVALCIGFIYARRFVRAGRPTAAVITIALAMSVVCIAAWTALRACEETISSIRFARVLGDVYREGDRFVLHGPYPSANSLQFYVPLRIEIYDAPPVVLQHGISYKDAPRVMITPSELAHLWSGGGRVFLLDSTGKPPGYPAHALLTSGGRTLWVNQAITSHHPPPPASAGLRGFRIPRRSLGRERWQSRIDGSPSLPMVCALPPKSRHTIVTIPHGSAGAGMLTRPGCLRRPSPPA